MRYKIISLNIVKAINNLKKQRYTPLHEPNFDNNDIKVVSECLKSTFVSSASKFTETFEKKIVKQYLQLSF